MKRAARCLFDIGLCLLLALMAGNPSVAQEGFPQSTAEGLERVESARLDAVYWRPGASLASYKRIVLLDCSVAFVKDWTLDQGARRAVYRADAEDMERIRNYLAGQFRTVFTRELEQRGGYEIVESAADDVLLLRPAIMSLDVTAPDLQVPGNLVNYVDTSGEMTLTLELYDSATNSLIGRAIDRQQGSHTGGMLISDSAKNREEADRMLQLWAGVLRDALDEQWAGGR
jgi:hypothetical protein